MKSFLLRFVVSVHNIFHQDAIRSDANFRQKFIEMCASLGVDPMSSNKTFSAKLGFGSFYTELGVQVLDVCMRTRSSNGGLIGLHDLTKRVISLRGSNSGGIETDDILRAVRSLQVDNFVGQASSDQYDVPVC